MLKLEKSSLVPAILALLMGRTNLLACSCNRIGPPCDATWKADAVFLGAVTRVFPPELFGFPLAWPIPTERRITFAVKERYTGPIAKAIEVLTDIGCCACGMEFEWGQDYLVYAYRVPGAGALGADICSRTSLARDAVTDLTYLRSLASRPVSAHVYGFITTNAWDARHADHTAAPVAGVAIHLTSKSGKWVAATDSYGAYDFAMLSAGAYSLCADLPGKHGGRTCREVLLHEQGCSQQVVLASEK